MGELKEWLSNYQELILPLIFLDLAILIILPVIMLRKTRSAGGNLFGGLLWCLAIVGFVLSMAYIKEWDEIFVWAIWGSEIAYAKEWPRYVTNLVRLAQLIYIACSCTVFFFALHLPTSFISYKKLAKSLEWKVGQQAIAEAREKYG